MIRTAPLSQRVSPRPQGKAKDQEQFCPHQQYWINTAGYALSALLGSAGYTPQSQIGFLHQYLHLVTPYMGASPDSELCHWKSFMTDTHTPVELSWDFHTGSERPTIRYSVEPISLDAGTASNPHNGTAGADFKRRLIRMFPETDTTLFNHFEIFFNQSWTNDAPEGHRSTVFWAFDLKEKAMTTKAYFFPGTVAHATNRSNLDVIADAITSSPQCTPETLVPFSTFSDYVCQNPDLKLEIDMLALDLIPVNKSRLKIYFRDRRTSFQSVRETMSLGGRVQDSDLEIGMKKLRRLWGALVGAQGLLDDAPLPQRSHRTAGILYNVEFKTQDSAPKVKLYIPVRHYAKNDEQIINALRGFLTEEVRSRQQTPIGLTSAERYSQCLHGIVHDQALQNDLGLHTYIGCSIQSGGNLRVVAYLNPQKSKLRNQGHYPGLGNF